MGFELISFSSGLVQKQAANEILKCNELSRRFGLVLTQAQALELVETRSLALHDNGRIEFGGGVIEKLIREFCDSPYISKYDYENTLHELIEMFYYYKNETMDLISDDDLIKFMGTSFKGICQGSLALLSGRELDRLARNLRHGYPADYNESQEDDYEENDDE